MKFLAILLLAFTFPFFNVFAQIPGTSFEKRAPFYPDIEQEFAKDIEWGFLTIPEAWNNPNSKTIKLAVAVLKNKANKKNEAPVLVVEGGPGAGAIESIWLWMNHPVRENRDVILVDTRGTGFSEPRLCPDLGKKFLTILAKNQGSKQDEREKVLAAIACKESLISNNIDINEYHSENIARDLNALKVQLNYKHWNLNAVSYGTYVAQVYANAFPEDIKTLILDSPIADIGKYYTTITSNYIRSLNKVFEACKNDSLCNSAYPDLERIYYKTIEQLTQKPITVKVDRSIIENGQFTYNAEDFKVAIHQALYQKQLIKVLPLLIYQFYNENEATLSALVAAFSGALSLDYGVYYCTSCTETLPYNSLTEFNKNARQYQALYGGLSFYKSDFAVCDKWNREAIDKEKEFLNLLDLNIPVLIFTGGFDPITPSSNGEALSSFLKNTYLVNRISYGHASSFTITGSKVVNEFINEPDKQPNFQHLQSGDEVEFTTKIKVNGGVSKLGNSINNFDILFFSPLIIALLISLAAAVSYLVLIIIKKNDLASSKLMKFSLLLCSILGITLIVGFVLALNNVASDNFYVLAFGLPENYSYLFNLLLIFLGVLLFTIAFFFVNIKRINERSVIFTVLFSNVLIGTYFYYWGFFSFV
jgi:pimeloyl-ACP methyl ester carboxylesterase